MREGTGTKNQIFETAMDLFANDNYYNVSMRQIAAAVGIKPSSIYNHYESKEAILQEIYRYFDATMDEIRPDLDELLLLAETAAPIEVMRRTVVIYPVEILPLISQAMLVTAAMARVDEEAGRLIHKNLVQLSFDYDVPLLERMLELGRIRPIDARAFALIHSNYCYSAAVRFYTGDMAATDDWTAGLDLLFQLVQPV